MLSVEAQPDETPPVADAGPNQLVDEVRAVHFDGSASTDDEGIVRYEWTFNYADGTVVLEGVSAYFMFEHHGEYTVTLTVWDDAGNSDEDNLSLTVLTPPGKITNITLIARSGWVEMAWSAPEDDGGTNITGTLVYRGIHADELVPWSSDWYMRFWHWDPIVENGMTYYYAFAAINAVGTGPLSDVYNSTPMAVPDRPQNLSIKSTGFEVHLSWKAPEPNKGRVPVTGYEVHRGTDPDWLYDTFDVGMNTTFIDTDVKVGKTYYYAVGARSELGSGNVTEVLNVTVEEPETEDSFVTMLVVLVPLVCMMAALGVWYKRQ
jgi:hypothetical protein